MHVAIAGGGIAGLSAALALARAGHRVTVLERSPAPSEAGAGIQLSPNATRVLDGLGLTSALGRHWVRPHAVRIRRGRDGALVVRMPLDRAESRWGSPFAVIHRGDLHAILSAAVRQEPEVDLRLGHPVDAISSTKAGVHLQAGDLSYAADLAVVADGVWSRLRATVLDDGPPRFTGRRAFRATIPAAAAPGWMREPATGLWLGSEAHLVHYPVEAGATVNLIAVVTDADDGGGWSRADTASALALPFGAWTEDIRTLLAGIPDWQSWPLFSRPPPVAMAAGQIALLGDAAHPTLPFLAQGGAMAMEDAAVLTAALADGAASLPDRLARFSSARVPRVRRVVTEARANDARYHWAPPLSTARDLGLRALGGERLLSRYDWLYGWRLTASA